MYETPWKVVGFEKFVSEKGAECVRLYVARPLSLPEGNSGEGLETNRIFYKPEYVKYEPAIGHLIVVQKGSYGISQIVVVGKDEQ